MSSAFCLHCVCVPHLTYQPVLLQQATIIYIDFRSLNFYKNSSTSLRFCYKESQSGEQGMCKLVTMNLNHVYLKPVTYVKGYGIDLSM